MKRSQAISKASSFLGRKNDIKTGSTAKKIKQKSKKNPDLDRARLNQIVADIYQRGSSPKDLDLQRVDFSTSYNNIRNQIKDLLDKRGNEKFANRRKAERESEMAYAKEKESEQLITVARVRHERRPPHSQYVDETKEAETKFGRVTDSSFEKWARNPNKYDIEGVDGKQEKGSQMPLPLKQESKVKDIRMREVELDTSDGSEVAFKNDADIYSDLKASSSDKLDFSDSRSDSQVKKSVSGTTSERSTQKGLREQGFASKSSEKTLDSFQDSVEEGGKELSGKFDGNYV